MHVNIKYVVMDGVNWIAQLPSHTLFLFEVWGDFLCLETQEQSGIIGVHNHSWIPLINQRVFIFIFIFVTAYYYVVSLDTVSIQDSSGLSGRNDRWECRNGAFKVFYRKTTGLLD